MNSLNVSNQRAITTLLTLCLLVPPADILCIQFEPRTDPKCADPGIFVRKRERERGGGGPTDRKKALRSFTQMA